MTQGGDGDLGGYPLQRQLLSSIRLYIQHWMWRRELGYLLHPAIPVGEGTRIADIACGNCAWLIDVARENPAAQIHGFDISPAQFPHSAWLPRNVKVSTLDILKPVPDKLRGQYTVVHVGLLVLVVQQDNPLPILENLLTLLSTCLHPPCQSLSFFGYPAPAPHLRSDTFLIPLEPGGYLQWDEADFGGLYVNSPHPDISCAALGELKVKVHSLLQATKGTTFGYNDLKASRQKFDMTRTDQL
ncbi:MAG: hypothetical protein Q9225_001027 [Loekoesia sp. 1 TL-2023]